MKKFSRKLIKSSSHSYTVVIPKELIKKYGWRERQWVVITDEGRGKLSIRDQKR